MPSYLPLCAFRHALLPTVCRSCAWWQTAGDERLSPESSAERHRQWMAGVEATWGTTGLLLESGGATQTPGTPLIVGSISFAPAGMLPRLRDFPFSSLTAGSALVFCLWLAEDQARMQAKRLLQKALGQLRSRGMSEVFAIAGSLEEPLGGEAGSGHQCGLLSVDFLDANGFEPVMQSGELVLMRADLRGLLALLGQVENAVRRVLHNEPTPSPAAWTHRGT